jgi:hypothetical protein
LGPASLRAPGRGGLIFQHHYWRNQMPVILWLLGVPLLVVVALMLFNVI